MTVRKQWLIVLTLTAVIAVGINSFLLSSLINRYFQTYTTESYHVHLGQIEELAKNALIEENFSLKQLSVQFESHLDDPILSIKLYDAQGRLMAAAENRAPYGHDMMSNRMKEMMNKTPEEVDSFEISDGNNVIGILNITRYCPINNSVVSNLFRVALIRNSLLSFGIVLIVLISIGIFVSKKMSKDLMNTASLALSMEMGEQKIVKLSKISEIKTIQEALKALNLKLKIRQMGRKRRIDELVHQVRTPLTILKTHIEGLEDGIIQMTPQEIDVCAEQVKNMTSIMENMSMILDADVASESVKPETIDIHLLLKQIVNGLKLQFDKKQINLSLVSQQRILISTDRDKFSQCMYNILTNAYKFTPSKGRVEISYTGNQDGVNLVVKDNGIGISSEDQENIFEAYFRGDNANAIAGEGLGLFVVKENLSKINGSMRVDSQLGQGSSFILNINKLKLNSGDGDVRQDMQN
ncbi:MAG: HAMP domain-containing histidine kinase [Clostridia bacterium]|nr:HAMP domain-containing histidine kinase [Clostridia bacterium]